MKKRLFILTCVLALWASSLSAQSWAGGFDYNKYQYSMTVYYQIKDASFDKYDIAAFIGRECRGIGEVVTATGTNGTELTYGFLKVYSNNASGETVTFKCYDKEQKKEWAIPATTVPFASDGVEGLPSEPLTFNLGSIGDANGDGTIDAADIVEVVNHLMGNYSYKFVEQYADANEDGEVNLSDIVTIVNMITGK